MNLDIPSLTMLVVKILILLGLGLYAAFAVIIVRQERLMAHVLEEEFEPVLRALVLVHLVGAVALFLLSVVLL